jgi:hypothetical protein
MSKASVCHNDPTTTGGKVIATTSTMSDVDRRIALYQGMAERKFKRFSTIRLSFGIFYFLCGIAAFSEEISSVALKDGYVSVTTPAGKTQMIYARDATSAKDVKLVDLTFNGQKDLMILRDRGANQEFYDVYLYSKRDDKFIYNKNLSMIPCLGVDVKSKSLIGQCFHESSCENWEEYYSLTSDGKTSIIERKGTYCDPTTGQSYHYTDQFRNGKRVSSSVNSMKNNSVDQN